MMSTKDSSETVNQKPRTLRLVWPQWQGAGMESIRKFFSEVPFEEARRGYAVGAAVLNAVLWIDSHPDVGTPASKYSGYHAMAIAVLTGNGDPDVLRLLPATLDPARVALVGLHSWTEDDFPNIARWGIRSFRPQDLHLSSVPLLDWLKALGCSRIAIHFDVDVVDSNEIVFGLGSEPNGLTSNEYDDSLQT